MFERSIIQNNTSNRMRTLDLLNLLGLGVRILYLLSELGDIRPIRVNNRPYELFLSWILPKQRGVGPFVFSPIFCHFNATFIQIVDNLWRILLDVTVVTNLIITNNVSKFQLLLFISLSVRVFLFLHSY